MPRFSYRIYTHYNELGKLLYHSLGIAENPEYVPVTVTRVYMLSKFGKVTNTAEIIEFPEADDAVRFYPLLVATEDKGCEGLPMYVSDINDADTYEYRKQYMEAELKSAGLVGSIEGNKIYFPYDLDTWGTSQGEIILECYGVYDEYRDYIQENEIPEYTEKNGYLTIADGTVEYIHYTTWSLNNVTQLDDPIVTKPCEIKMYIYRKENR